MSYETTKIIQALESLTKVVETLADNVVRLNRKVELFEKTCARLKDNQIVCAAPVQAVPVIGRHPWRAKSSLATP
jgi:hypothetical protein